MLTRLSRFGSVYPRLFINPSRFVSQSKPSGATVSPTVTELHPAAKTAEHGEVNEYVKVSFSVRTVPLLRDSVTSVFVTDYWPNK